MYTVDDEAASSGMTKENSRAAYCLVLPGKTLYLTPLLNIKKFRAHGNKDGAVTAFFQLQEENLGKICYRKFKGKSSKYYLPNRALI